MEPNQGAGDTVGNVDEMVDMQYVDKSLPVPLTNEERLELGEDMAQAHESSERVASEKKAKDELFKAEISEFDDKVTQIRKTLRHGKVDKVVQCKVARDYRVGHFQEVRMDTAEVLVSRPMSADERQMGMDFTK